MADEQEFQKKILISVESKTQALKEQAAIFNTTLDEMKAKLKDVELASGKNSVAYQAQASKIRIAQEAIRANNKELDNASKALAGNANSIAQNRALLATLTAEHIRLAQTEGASSIKAKEMEATLLKLTNTLKAQTSAYGDNRMFVGGYTEALDKMKAANETANSGFKDLTGSMMATAGGFGFMPQSVATVTSAFTGAITASKNVVTGFMAQNAVMQEAKTAYEQLVVANEASTAATTESTAAQELLAAANEEATVAANSNAVAQEKLAAGEITEAEAARVATLAQQKQAAAELTQAEAANIAAIAEEKNRAATEAQTVAQAASTAATEAGTTGLKLLRIALASTGIGLLIIALGALFSYFTSTNEGAKKFKVILNEIGAVVQVGIKLFSGFGETIFNAISHPIESLKELGKMIMDNIINRFKAVSVILDGIIHMDFKKVADGVIQSFSGVEHATDKIARIGNGIADFASKASAAAKAAGDITRERQALTKEERQWSEEKLKQEGILGKLKLQIRDVGIKETERLKIAKQAKDISDQVFAKDVQHAQKNAELVEKEQALNSKKDYQAITDAKNRVQELKNAHDQEVQSIQNREDRVGKSLDRLGQKEETLQQKKDKADKESENLRQQSITRQLQSIYDSYGDEILAADQHYKDELVKLDKFLTDKLISKAKYNQVEKQLENEKNSKISEIIDKFSKQDAAAVLKAQSELVNLHNQGIKNENDRELAQIKEQSKEKLAALDVEADNLLELTQREAKEIQDLKSKGKKSEAAAIQKEYDSNLKILKLNGEKRVEVTRQTIDELKRVNDEAKNLRIASQDEADVINTDKPGQESAHFAALKKQLLDEYTLKIDNEIKLGRDTATLRAEFRQKEEQLVRQYNLSRFEKAKQYEQSVQNAVFSIVSNSIKHDNDARLTALGHQKDAELKNTSLTASQKNIIEEKYRVLEGQEKVKEFKANQKLSIAQALINGALAITKAYAELGPLGFATLAPIIATTALEIGTIASQKAPSYAIGGLHYSSDGRGTLLSGPGTGTSDSMNARVSNGEAIINAKSTSHFGGLLSAINQWGGGVAFNASRALGHAFLNTPGFAAGGYYSSNTYLPSIDNGLRANPATQSTDINYDRLIGGISDATVNAISQMPPIYVDVKDVSYQQGRLAAVEDRATNL